MFLRESIDPLGQVLFAKISVDGMSLPRREEDGSLIVLRWLLLLAVDKPKCLDGRAGSVGWCPWNAKVAGLFKALKLNDYIDI